MKRHDRGAVAGGFVAWCSRGCSGAKRLARSSTLWTVLALGAVFGPAVAQNSSLQRPSGLTANPGGGSTGYPAISLTWSGVQGANSYSLHRATSEAGVAGSAALTGYYNNNSNNNSYSYMDAPVQPGTLYYYGVTATGYGPSYTTVTSPWSDIIYAYAPPAMPVVNAAADHGFITLSWTGVTGPAGATTYTVRRYVTTAPYGTPPNGNNWTVIKTGITGTTYTDPGLDPSSQYYYTVTAVISQATSAGVSAESVPSQSVNATPLPPTIPAAPTILRKWYTLNGTTSADLQLTIGNVPGAAFYRVYWAQGLNYARLDLKFDNVLPGQTNTLINQTGLALGTTYTYAATAVNSAGESPQSAAVTITPQVPQVAPGPLTNLNASPGDGVVNLTWTASNPPAAQYNIVRTPGTGGPNSFTTSTVGVSYPDTGLTDGVLYSYTVTPVNGNLSGTAGTTTATPQAAPPGPANLQANATKGLDQVMLTWNTYGEADHYYIFRSGVAVGNVPYLATTVDAATTYIDNTVQSGSQYYYVIQAVSGGVVSSPSAKATAITFLHNSNLFARPGDRSVSLTWDPVQNATGYVVGRGILTNGSDIPTNWSNITTTSNTTFPDSGLINGTEYGYGVYAFNGLSYSSDWAKATATPINPINLSPPSSNTTLATTCDTISFTATATDTAGTANLIYTWDFGDGTAFGNGSIVSHQYKIGSSGAGFLVKVTASDTVTHASDTKSFYQKVTLLPITATITSSKNPATTCDMVTFSAIGSDPCGGSLTYTWDFGDNTPGANGMTVNHRYKTASLTGGFVVKLTLTDSANNVPGVVTLPEIVTLAPVTVTINGYPNPATTCGPVQFSAMGPDPCNGGTLSYVWNFGDGTPATPGAANVTHQYTTASPGQGFPVTVKATDSLSGQFGTANWLQPVTLESITIHNMDTNPSPITTCNMAQIYAYATNNCGTYNFNYSWDFGDGTPLQPNGQHQYTKASADAGFPNGFPVTLTVTDLATGMPAQRTVYQIVTLPPLLIQMMSPSRPATTCDNIPFYVYAYVPCGTSNLTYSWDFGDHTPPDVTGYSVNHRYAAASPDGGWPVIVTVTDSVTKQKVTGNLQQVVTLAPINMGMLYSNKNPATTCDNISFYVDAYEPCGSDNLDYSWDFGDHTPPVPGNSVNHQYAAASPDGGWPVIVTITDRVTKQHITGNLQQVVHWPTVSMSSANATPNPALVNQTVTFSSGAYESCNGSQLQYTWTFGDGTPGNGQSPTHQYATAGTFTATVTATDPVSQMKDSRDVVVTVLDFGLYSDSPDLTINPGASGTAQVTVSPTGSFDGAVSLSAVVEDDSGSPVPNVTATLSPALVSLSDGNSHSSALTVSAGIGAPPGDYTVVVTGTAPGLSRTTTLGVSITTPDFTLAAAPADLNVSAGGSGSAALNLAPLNGFAGTVNISVTGAAGISAMPGSSTLSLTGGGATTSLTVGVPAGTAPGIYTLQVVGTAGGATHSATVTINVGAVNASILVMRTGSANTYASSATVAAGGNLSQEHTAQVSISVSPPQAGVHVDAPQVLNGQGVSVNASLAMNSATTDANGTVTGVFTSSDTIGVATLQLGSSPGSPSAQVDQRWDDLAGTGTEISDNTWPDLGTAVPINYSPAFLDGNGSGNYVPIPHHSMGLQVVDMDVYEWDDASGLYWPVTYTPEDIAQIAGDSTTQQWLNSLVSFSPLPASEPTPGSYQSNMTLTFNSNDIVVNVDYWIQDNSAYGP